MRVRNLIPGLYGSREELEGKATDQTLIIQSLLQI